MRTISGSTLLQPFNDFGQLFQPHGLGEEQIESTGECLLLGTSTSQPCQRNDRSWRETALLLPPPDLSRGFEPIQARHIDVH